MNKNLCKALQKLNKTVTPLSSCCSKCRKEIFNKSKKKFQYTKKNLFLVALKIRDLLTWMLVLVSLMVGVVVNDGKYRMWGFSKAQGTDSLINHKHDAQGKSNSNAHLPQVLYLFQLDYAHDFSSSSNNEKI